MDRLWFILLFMCVCDAETSGCAAACSQEEALSAALSANRSLLLERLERDARLEQVRRLRAEVMADVLWLSSSSGDVSWDFVQELLVLLLTLARHLSAEVEGFERSSPSPVSAEKVPSLSPDVLSVTQQQKLSSALQFVVSLGLCSYLAPGVGVPLAHRSAFAVQLQQLCCGRVEDARRRLFTTTTVLLKMAELPSLGTLVFTRHLNDVMAALCQLGHQRAPVRGGDAGKVSVHWGRRCWWTSNRDGADDSQMSPDVLGLQPESGAES